MTSIKSASRTRVMYYADSGGSASPKKTIPGFRSLPQLGQCGTAPSSDADYTAVVLVDR